MSNVVQIKVPDIGDFKEVEVIEVLVAVGDTIKAEQSLITVESDKASMEIPASQGGVVKSIAVKVGDKEKEYKLDKKTHVHDTKDKEVKYEDFGKVLVKDAKIELVEDDGKLVEINLK